MKVVVTGGAGFVGHNLAAYLLERGYSVVVFDNLERSSPLALRRIKELGVPLVKSDVRDSATLESAARGADLVVHAAAYISVEESVLKPELYFENNVLGTLSVARVCSRLGVPVVYLSSAAVYGEPVKLPVSEDHPTRPLSPYGLSKLFGEEVLALYGRSGLKYVVLRLFNVYGPGQRGEYAGVIAKFLESALSKRNLIIYGDGSQTRDFVHVEDVARVVELAALKEAYGEVFNVGSGKPVAINALAELVRRLACAECEVEYRAPRPGDVKHSYADITKARRTLGFEPKVSLEEGLADLIRRAARVEPGQSSTLNE